VGVFVFLLYGAGVDVEMIGCDLYYEFDEVLGCEDCGVAGLDGSVIFLCFVIVIC